jgi:cysteinyl-tRNA synthetase
MPAEIQLYNTISRKVEPLRPLQSPAVKLYACGPTIYNFGHIGNFRTYVAVDVLSRALRASGYQVKHVMQFTDVDDKTIRDSRAANLPLKQFTDKFRVAFLEDSAILNLANIADRPNATDHIPAMVGMVEQLVEKGFAYASEGSVYYRIAAFPRYGCLCHLDMSGLQHGHRVSVDDEQKEGVGDFALWKAWAPADGEVGWESPWGRGRPGWHIECSALAKEFLGEEIDLHAGGVDLRFPHHENELAQSEAANGKTFARHWFHVEHLLVEGQKMSKSLGNYFTVRDVLAKNYTGRELRYALISGAHYRTNLNFTWQGMDDARAALRRLDEWRTRLQEFVGPDRKSAEAAPMAAEFQEALRQDLNVSLGLGAIFTAVRTCHKALDEGTMTKESALSYLQAWAEIDEVLGLGEAKAEVPAEVLALVEERKQARLAKDFKKSDAIRAKIVAQGWQVKDGPKGQELVKG